MKNTFAQHISQCVEALDKKKRPPAHESHPSEDFHNVYNVYQWVIIIRSGRQELLCLNNGL